MKLSGGVPTISFRDLAIQRRENDLIGASFGRGFYIFDDYSVLRYVSEEQLRQEATLFPPRKAWWYIPRQLGVIQGASHYTAPNPPFGAVFTYYLKDALTTLKAIRQKKEKERIDKKRAVKFPGWDKVEAERRQEAPQIWLTVKDNEGHVIRRIEGVNQKGFHRAAWDLRYPSTDAISDVADIGGDYIGAMVAPPLVAFITIYWGWREAFVITGLTGFVWLALWLLLFRQPKDHERITQEELDLIGEEEKEEIQPDGKVMTWKLFRFPEVWAVVGARFLAEHVWHFYVLWLPKYLREMRDFSLFEIGVTVWIPFLAARRSPLPWNATRTAS